MAGVECVDDRAVVRVAIGRVARVEIERLDTRFARALQSGGVRAVRHDERDRRVEASGRDGVDDRLQVAPAPGDEDANSGTGVRMAGDGCRLSALKLLLRPVTIMPRRPRGPVGDPAYHILNRAVRRAALFEHDSDYAEFETVLLKTLQLIPVRLLAYCAMPNHWHLVVWPGPDGRLPYFMHRLTMIHAQRWHVRHGTAGTGPVYQGRYKSVRVEADGHLLTACRYVERNPLRAGLVTCAEDWRWSSLWRRHHHCADCLSDWADPDPVGLVGVRQRSFDRGGTRGTGPHLTVTRDPSPVQTPVPRPNTRPPYKHPSKLPVPRTETRPTCTVRFGRPRRRSRDGRRWARRLSRRC